jgi:hypothetical protein
VGSSSTNFIEPGTPSASFANVCVGDTAGAVGSSDGSGGINATWVFVAPPGWHP